jgi:dihydrofolate synthase / folylpolyglutamate synthase
MNKFDPAAYLASLNIDVMHFGLAAVSGLLARLGNPQNVYKTILIAGTNGKGSTAAMTASILRCAGYKTGLYTSPHLVDVRERIAVDGGKISRSDFRRIVGLVKKEIKQPVTYFEVLTAAAFLYFQHRKIDIAVLEAGLGGRLDATNVCRPLVSVITNIGFDHTAYLGKTLTAIAGEKSGIIKQKGICITAAKQKKVLAVLERTCRHRRAGFYSSVKDMKIEKQKDGNLFYRGIYGDLNNLIIPLPGRHQWDNAALALAAIEIVGKKGMPVGPAAIRKGLAKTKWPARLEILLTNPLFVLDGAHNPAGIDSLCRALKKDFDYRKLILIFGVLSDKDYRGMLRKIAPLTGQIILTPLMSTRAASLEDIYAYGRKLGAEVMLAANVTGAIKFAMELAGGNDMICATGSLYLAGEIKRAFPGLVPCGKKSENT